MEKLKNFFTWYRQSWLYKATIIGVAFILFTLLMDKLIMPLYIKLGDESEMPDVIEMYVNEARDVLTQKGFQVLVQDSMYDANHEEGYVIEQNPYPYATVK